MKRGKKANSRFNFVVKNTICSKSKRSQTVFGMSFGMIFSIILIIFFIVTAIMVVNYFLDMKKCAQIGLFINDLENEVERAKDSEKASFEFDASLPSNLEFVCFADLSVSLDSGTVADEISFYEYENANMFFYPMKNACDMPYYNLKYIDIGKITGDENPYCVPVENGKISIDINKEYRNALVGLK